MPKYKSRKWVNGKWQYDYGDAYMPTGDQKRLNNTAGRAQMTTSQANARVEASIRRAAKKHGDDYLQPYGNKEVRAVSKYVNSPNIHDTTTKAGLENYHLNPKNKNHPPKEDVSRLPSSDKAKRKANITAREGMEKSLARRQVANRIEAAQMKKDRAGQHKSNYDNIVGAANYKAKKKADAKATGRGYYETTARIATKKAYDKASQEANKAYDKYSPVVKEKASKAASVTKKKTKELMSKGKNYINKKRKNS